jgi:hypothetical protein
VAKIRTLSKSSVINLQRMSDRLNLLEQATSGGRSRYRDSSAHFLVKTPTAGIPALASTTPGSAICKIVKRMSSGLVDTGRDQKVYNLGNAVDGGQIVVAHRDAFGDLWVTDEASCDTLKPGTYRAIAGATIEPGETGPIVITGCDGEVSVDAVNHSECTFYLGDRITASVDPCCVVHFTGCSCCGSAHEPPACCDISIAICIAGVSKILKVDGGTYTWTVADCCDCTGATLAVTLSCSGSNIAVDWTYTCGESVTTGTIDLDALCNFDDDVEIVDQLSICSGSLSDRWANFVEECDPCTDPPPCECCLDMTTWTIDECDRSEVPGFVDDVGLTAVSSSVDPVCDGNTTVVTLTFTNNSGGDYGGGADPIDFVLTSNIVSDYPTCTAASNSGTITPDAIGKGFAVEWPMPGTWANGATIVRTVTMQNNGCTVSTSTVNAQVSAGRGYICNINWTAVACP